MDGKTITLKHPFQANGREITEVTLRHPKARDLKAMDRAGGAIQKMALLIGNLTELAPEEVDELAGADFAAIAEVVGDFLGVVPETLGQL